MFEATALGYVDRLRDRLDEDPSRPCARPPTASRRSISPRSSARPRRRGSCSRRAPRSNVVAGNEMRVQPLHSAAAGRHLEVCRLLLAAGADVDARQAGGFTPLHAAAQNGDPELVELFLSARADPPAPTDDGETPADTAEAAGHPDVARRLRRGRGRRVAPPAPTRGRRSAGVSSARGSARGPRVDDRVVDLLLVAGGVEVVVDDVLAEDLDRGLAALELPDRLVQRARHPRMALGDVAVALELGLERQLVLDAVQARRRSSPRRSGRRSCRRPGSGPRRGAPARGRRAGSRSSGCRGPRRR